MSNPVVQWQIVAQDPEAVVRFYKELFGWTVKSDNALGYRQVDTGEGGMSGGVWPGPPGSPTMMQLFIAVDDVEASSTRATALGATVIVPPTALPDGDTMAIMADPNGLTFGMMGRRE